MRCCRVFSCSSSIVLVPHHVEVELRLWRISGYVPRAASATHSQRDEQYLKKCFFFAWTRRFWFGDCTGLASVPFGESESWFREMKRYEGCQAFDLKPGTWFVCANKSPLLTMVGPAGPTIEHLLSCCRCCCRGLVNTCVFSVLVWRVSTCVGLYLAVLPDLTVGRDKTHLSCNVC